MQHAHDLHTIAFRPVKDDVRPAHALAIALADVAGILPGEREIDQGRKGVEQKGDVSFGLLLRPTLRSVLPYAFEIEPGGRAQPEFSHVPLLWRASPPRTACA